MDFNEGYIYFGTKKSNVCFDKYNSQGTIDKIISYYKDKEYSTTIKNIYTYLDRIYDKTPKKKKVVASYINENTCKVYLKMTQEPFFPCTNNYSYKLQENIHYFKIHEKIFININQHNHIYIKFIKDSYYDEVKPILEKTIQELSTIHKADI